jgi:hypothetical protein
MLVLPGKRAAAILARMTRADLQQQLLELPEDERRLFVTWFYENEYKLLGSAEDISWQDSLSAEQIAELQRRMKEVDEHPERLIPWEEALDRVRHTLSADARTLQPE